VSPARRRQGEGGVTFVEGKGLWRGSIELAPDPETGKRRRKEFNSKVKGEVIRKLREYQRELDEGRTVVSKSPTVAAWLDHWIAEVAQVRPLTRRSYESSLQYVRASLGRKKLDKLTVDDVRRWHADMRSGKVSGTGNPLSSTTMHTAHLVFSKALSDAVLEGRLGRNVCKMVKAPPRAAQSISVLDVGQIAAVVETVRDDRLGSRWVAALLTAMRQGELLGLRWQDVNFEAGTLDVAWQLQRIPQRHGCSSVDGQPACGRLRGSDCPKAKIDAPADWEHEHLVGGLYLARPKTATGWRVIPLVHPMLGILRRRYEASQQEPNPFGLVWTSEAKRALGTGRLLPLDGSPIDPSDDSAAWHDVLTRAGTPQLRLHDARHTAITVLYDRKVPEAVIQQIAGQSTVATTRGYRGKFAYQLVEGMEALGAAAEPAALSEKQTVLSITPRSPGEA
jgi:integrase